MSTAVSLRTPTSSTLNAVRKGAGSGVPRDAGTAKPRLNCIQAFRAVAVLVVVCAHLYGLEVRYFQTDYMAPMRRYGWASVDLLFVISGVVISLIAEGKFRNRHNAFEFIYHRITRVYPVFWFYFFIVLAAFYIAPETINNATGHQAAVLRSLFLLPSQYGNLLYQAWTLTYEVWFYAVIFVFMLFIEERFLPLALAAWALAVTGVNLFHLVPSTSYVLSVLTGPFVYEFIIGCFVFQLFRRPWLTARSSAVCILVGLLGVVASTLITVYKYRLDAAWIESSFWLRPVVCGAIAGPVLLGAMGMERAGHLKFVNWMAPVGDWSYSIYLSHTIVIKSVGYLLRPWIVGLPAAIVYLDVAALPASVLLGYLSYRFLERPTTRFFYKSFPDRFLAFGHAMCVSVQDLTGRLRGNALGKRQVAHDLKDSEPPERDANSL
jgi:peptidoglycan/LPS O-acetylase OafA/YrhL